MSNIQQIALPTTWADLTVAQYLALATPGAISLATVLPDLAPEVVAQLSDADQQLLADRVLAELDEQVLADLLPTHGLLEIGRSAYGLYDQAQQYLATIPNAHPLAHGAYLYALYRAPTGSRADEQQLAAAHAAVLARPVTTVYADCLYFLASYRRVGTGAPAVGVRQSGTLSIAKPAFVPQSLRARLGNLWNPGKQAQA
jgi:hypothetical protein